ncbi:tRNA (adenosine(37)-N6)-threonylcarbamoyltransferase complex dimerization subunit type 1 TsaB [Actinomycetospora lemnae]|uniref:tRNA (Adenosine(37)-N6)-threonylcarbamoyltransferase complex dimerization subunit type 1 TsaB n=1 Tax=Actinomycetospora lemnae TaxID=3019891 RepID=A0ABT5SVU1_9PSEU|nr:tRNA (adenosine(37)-N6)-threonylcarbamoyltransferase complex dimerization subunit type 1 TsaB [Actinomycetospora sp. DW7H6]MDD7966590.1 tRNA (adenosine(37)-N6)-threonylcarbamoyltransferase complex dimerization subunit type 1 TsaB [Actinomycetospora sp. DW7H6]
MLVLALDTATARITAGVVELDPSEGPPTTLAARDAEGARAHAELLAPAVAEALAEAGRTRADLDAVVAGLGPGPFTGLRVGLVTAAAVGDALGIPVHGVPTHDALAAGSAPLRVPDDGSGSAPLRVPDDGSGSAPLRVPDDGSGSAPLRVLVVTDARRREVYWSLLVDGVRTHGPDVVAPAELAARLAPDGDLGPVDRVLGDAAAQVGAGTAETTALGPTPEGLVAVAAPALRAGTDPGPLVPLYLRRPDAVPPGAPKAVTRG